MHKILFAVSPNTKKFSKSYVPNFVLLQCSVKNFLKIFWSLFNLKKFRNFLGFELPSFFFHEKKKVKHGSFSDIGGTRRSVPPGRGHFNNVKQPDAIVCISNIWKKILRYNRKTT